MSAAVNPTVIATGYEHTCVALSDGTIKLWGQGEFGSLGNGSTSSNNVGDSSGETPDNLTAIGTINKCNNINILGHVDPYSIYCPSYSHSHSQL